MMFSKHFTLRDTKQMSLYIHNAHSEGDLLIFYPKENVLHTGNLFMEGSYPYVDIERGGTIEGLIKGLDYAVVISDDNTKIIPGQGLVSTRDDLILYRNILITITERVRLAKRERKDLEEVQGLNITNDWDDMFAQGKISGEAFIQSLYESL